jgi:hypothetical protein
MYYWFRRGFALGITVLCSLILFLYYDMGTYALRPPQFDTGWLLCSALVFLALYNGRKKLPFLPLFRSSTWLQFHIYVGFFTMWCFLVHIQFQFPTGWYETIFALCYCVTALSGVFGLTASRILPARLSASNEEFIYERIPMYRHQIKEQVEALLLQSAQESQSTTLTKFYQDHLFDFFIKPRNLLAHCVASTRHLKELFIKVESLKRYTTKDELPYLKEMETCIRQKNNLDYQYALQTLLKGWLFVHIALTYSLLLLSLVHILLVYAFHGGVS